MLFSLLRELGWLDLARGAGNFGLRIRTLNVSDVIAVMSACATHGRERLLGPECAAKSATDAALVAASYYAAVLFEANAGEELTGSCLAVVVA
jgi:hypothetical protein